MIILYFSYRHLQWMIIDQVASYFTFKHYYVMTICHYTQIVISLYFVTSIVFCRDWLQQQIMNVIWYVYIYYEANPVLPAFEMFMKYHLPCQPSFLSNNLVTLGETQYLVPLYKYSTTGKQLSLLFYLFCYGSYKQYSYHPYFLS